MTYVSGKRFEYPDGLNILNNKLQFTIAGPSSVFEKWSGHVEPKGSRMGVFMDIPEKKIGFTISRSDFIASESLGLRQMSILQASYRDFCW